MTATGYCEFVFGKRWRELSSEEKKEYYKLMKRRSRNLDPNVREKARAYYQVNKETILAKRNEWNKNNPEKVEEYKKNHSQKKEFPYEKSLSRQMFGCAVTEMTPEQRKIYNTTRCLRYQKRKRDESKYSREKQQD